MNEMEAMKVDRRVHLATVDSTNSYVRRMLSAGDVLPDVTLVDADEQTAGRGQRGNSWESESGQNLSFSLVCHPVTVKASEQFVLSQAIALAVVSVVNDEIGLTAEDCTVKWPNDIYIGNRKVSGTLIECDLRGSTIETCIIGTGINVNQLVFRSDAPNPVSMAQVAGRVFDREHVLAGVVERFAELYQQILQGQTEPIRQAYHQHLYRREGLFRYADETGLFLAEILDVERTGHLLLRTAEGDVRRYEFKEVKFVF